MEGTRKFTDTELLDQVLDFIATSQSARGSITDGGIIKHIERERGIKIAGDKLGQILRKLTKDEFVLCETRNQQMEGFNYGLINHYSISWEGSLQNELGGYKSLVGEAQKVKELQRISEEREKTTVFLTRVLAWGTSVAALYYALEILKMFFPCWFAKP